MIIDLSDVGTLLLKALGAVLLALLIAAIRLTVNYINLHSAKLGIEISDKTKAALEDVARKSVTAGVVQSEAIIAAKGWSHPDVKNVVVARAVQYAVDQFSDTLARSGVDTSPDKAAEELTPIMQRKLPSVVSEVSASPATPPVNPAPAPASFARMPLSPATGQPLDPKEILP